MKWFFAVNELTLDHHDHDFPGLMLAGVASALANTKLEPHLIYDGRENVLTSQLRALGVRIVPHRISFHTEIEQRKSPHYNLPIASGAYLRTEIPGLSLEDEFVLYTDCDILFLKEPSFLGASPPVFACAPQFSPTDYSDLNTGVMLMNVSQLRADWPAFRNHIVDNFESFIAFDQGAYLTYYKDRISLLPPEANWKPYWGRSEAAEIVHFHGPKPPAIRKALDDPGYEMPADWRALFDRNVDSYRYHLSLWDHFHSLATAAVGTVHTVPPSRST